MLGLHSRANSIFDHRCRKWFPKTNASCLYDDNTAADYSLEPDIAIWCSSSLLTHAARMASQGRISVKLEESPEPQKPIHHNTEKTDTYEPLAILPAPLELLILASRYVEAAHRLTPIIARSHSSHHDHLESEDYHHESRAAAESETASTHATFVSLYRRYMTAALAACSSAVKLGGPDVQLNLQARLMLAQLLATETQNPERAEEVIARAVRAMYCNFSDLEVLAC